MGGAYFDNNATTPLDPRVREAMLPWMGESWGNPSSVHRFGQRAHAAVEDAREEVAALLGGRPEEVVFTSSGTEANNAVVRAGFARARPGDRLVLSGFEHPSIRVAAAAWAPEAGVELVWVSPGEDGVVPAERFREALAGGAALAALMLANNELGTLQPVAEVARVCRERGIPILCDAVQAAGKTPLDVAGLGADYVTIGAHKFHGPLGAAALWIRPGSPFEPLLVGGGQERGRRASTANVAALVGFGAACAHARSELATRVERLATLRDRFERGLRAIAGATIHAAQSPRLPHTTSVAFADTVNAELMMRLDLAGYAVSTGSACASGAVEPSQALAAMRLDHELAISTLRVSFGITNAPDEVDAFLPVLAREVEALRAAAAARR